MQHSQSLLEVLPPWLEDLCAPPAPTTLVVEVVLLLQLWLYLGPTTLGRKWAKTERREREKEEREQRNKNGPQRDTVG